jgi:hypothetical protein
VTVEKQRVKTLNKITLIEMEYEQILQYTRKKGPESRFFSLDREELEDLYKERKNRKYAALIVELYAVVEQFLKKTYSFYNNGEKYTKERNNRKNVVHDLEDKLGHFLEFKSDTKMLCDIRNFLVHDTFSFKKAMKDEDAMKNVPDAIIEKKHLFTLLLHSTREYISGIEIRV